MCIAIFKQKDNFISERTLRNCFNANPHGAGFALYNPSLGLVVKKGLMTFNEFIEAYRPFSGEDKSLLTWGAVHFRIATHGAVNEENTHPFVIERQDGYKLAIVHNGIIAKLSNNKDTSDTKLFVEQILTPLIENDKYAWRNEGATRLIIPFIGWSKMVLIDSEGNSVIYNEHQGHWVDNTWFSNYTFDDYYGYRTIWGDGYGGFECYPQQQSVIKDENGATWTRKNGVYERELDPHETKLLESQYKDYIRDKEDDGMDIGEVLTAVTPTKPFHEMDETPTPQGGTSESKTFD